MGSLREWKGSSGAVHNSGEVYSIWKRHIMMVDRIAIPAIKVSVGRFEGRYKLRKISPEEPFC